MGKRGRSGGGEGKRGRSGGGEGKRGMEEYRIYNKTRMSNELLNLSFCSYKRKELLASIANIRNFKACNIHVQL